MGYIYFLFIFNLEKTLGTSVLVEFPQLETDTKLHNSVWFGQFFSSDSTHMYWNIYIHVYTIHIHIHTTEIDDLRISVTKTILTVYVSNYIYIHLYVSFYVCVCMYICVYVNNVRCMYLNYPWLITNSYVSLTNLWSFV